MSINTGVVPQVPPHKINRGGHMDKKYDATYKLGNTTVHIVAPAPMSEEEKERRIREFNMAGWSAWNSLPEAERLRINKEYEAKKGISNVSKSEKT